MTHEVKEDMLTQLVNKAVENSSGEYLGEIVEIRKNKEKSVLEYIILKTSICYGEQDRFFAIPVCPAFVNYTGDIISLEANKEDLQFARDVNVDKLPKPDTKFSQSIFEIYAYDISG